MPETLPFIDQPRQHPTRLRLLVRTMKELSRLGLPPRERRRASAHEQRDQIKRASRGKATAADALQATPHLQNVRSRPPVRSLFASW